MTAVSVTVDCGLPSLLCVCSSYCERVVRPDFWGGEAELLVRRGHFEGGVNWEHFGWNNGAGGGRSLREIKQGVICRTLVC